MWKWFNYLYSKIILLLETARCAHKYTNEWTNDKWINKKNTMRKQSNPHPTEKPISHGCHFYSYFKMYTLLPVTRLPVNRHAQLTDKLVKIKKKWYCNNILTIVTYLSDMFDYLTFSLGWLVADNWIIGRRLCNERLAPS